MPTQHIFLYLMVYYSVWINVIERYFLFTLTSTSGIQDTMGILVQTTLYFSQIYKITQERSSEHVKNKFGKE